MQVESRNGVMLMGTSSREYEGKFYYNADVYDMESGNMYRCAVDQERFQKLANIAKPVSMKSVVLDISNQYQGRSRISLLGWS